MLYTKDGYPEINEIVKCTVKKIYGNTTFLYLDEYEKEGVLTISEIAPGRIRNLREYVTEDKTIVCKVLRVDPKQNRIDVSLRRVPIPVMKDKLEELKKEEYAERIYIDVAKISGLTKDELFEKTYEPIFENYLTVFEALYTIMLDNSKIDMFKNIDKKTKDAFLKIIDERIKPEEVCLKKKFHLSTYDIQGIDLITSSIKNSLNPLNYNKINIIYLAAGEFEIKITHDDIKSANNLYDDFIKNLEKISKDNKLDFTFSE
ncbi:MAG: S1 RNA-binding domain-containing protein [Nanoarchaeota archaeon]|nr:S1 RNA-binding domain-containing protein [Nanoarchaeota archaeon]